MLLVADIEAEMNRTQKNKATAAHLGSLKAKLAKYKRELMVRIKKCFLFFFFFSFFFFPPFFEIN